MNDFAANTYPTWVIVAVAALALVQIALQITALVQLVRTPAERVSIGGRKWVWVLIIALGEIAGAVLWFVIGRTPAPAADQQQASTSAEKDSAIDSLYGQGR